MTFKRILFTFIFLFLEGCSFEGNDSELCFIGDSITYLWDLEYFFPNYHITKHAVSGAVVEDIDEWDVSDCKGIPTILLIGTNNIGYMKSTDKDAGWIKTEFTNKYIQRAEKLQAAPLIAISILPRNFEDSQDSTTNIYLRDQNESIVRALDSSEIDFIFLNIFNNFLEDHYNIKKDLFKDGLHPNEEGYEILANKVQEAL